MIRKFAIRDFVQLAGWSAGLVIVAIGLGFLIFSGSKDRGYFKWNDTNENPTEQQVENIEPINESAKSRDLTVADALAENARLPFSNEPIEPAMPFYLSKYLLDPHKRKQATDCLASAIYYEAGFQSEQEKRAVAQVILNRVRHPAFPRSLCKVVYQGSERVTGCQFTFTCDGSEGRRPETNAWRSARAVALVVLEGSVEESIGMATHFHADYVQPYWAPNLTKIEQVGRHIFYRWNGSWGRRAAFSQLPIEDEPIAEALSEPVPIVSLDEFSGQQSYEEVSAIVADKARLSPWRYNSALTAPVSKGDLLADEADTGLIVDENIRAKD